MKRKNTKEERQPDCDLAKLIDALERAATAAVKIYRAVLIQIASMEAEIDCKMQSISRYMAMFAPW